MMGQWTETATVDRASSAMPLASFPIILAVAGTIAKRLDLSARSIWMGFQSNPALNRSTMTGLREMTWN